MEDEREARRTRGGERDYDGEKMTPDITKGKEEPKNSFLILSTGEWRMKFFIYFQLSLQSLLIVVDMYSHCE